MPNDSSSAEQLFQNDNAFDYLVVLPPELCELKRIVGCPLKNQITVYTPGNGPKHSW